jgi:hypothetical protein
MKKNKQQKDKVMVEYKQEEPEEQPEEEPQEQPKEKPKEQPKDKKANRWISHVKDVAKTKNITYREALKIASATYTK